MLGTEASATEFTLTASTKTITVPTGFVGTLWIRYQYETDKAVEVVNSASNFPTAGQFILEVLGNDVCDKSTKYGAMVNFPNAKLTSNVELAFTTEGTHPFTISCMQDYCDNVKKLFSIIVPDAA